MKKIRVLLADDHLLVADALKSLLEPTYEVVGIVEDGRLLIEAAERLKPDLIVADVGMPQLNGLDATRQIKRLLPRGRSVSRGSFGIHPETFCFERTPSRNSAGHQGRFLPFATNYSWRGFGFSPWRQRGIGKGARANTASARGDSALGRRPVNEGNR
jgi:hypothetical protein